MITSEFLCTLDVDVGELVSLGSGPLGERRRVEILGGTFEGPRMKGTVIPGADWQLLRQDGVLDLDARYALRDESGALIHVLSQGMRHGPPEVMACLARGESVDPSSYFFRSVMRFETSAPALDFLNRTIAVATAERKARKVELTAWAIL
ncbi:MAG: DUF3237 domain-containing protein [Polaromonas sp.]|nr:DUF3237 domain-containing protein [Polaromonas sp.]MDP3413840.1 DUF3237 domain-containing protein [Polaromonas sp.]